MARSLFFGVGIALLAGSVFPALAAGQDPLAARAVPGAPGGAAAAAGELAGVVTTTGGVAVGDVLISLSGPGGSALAVSDAAGRFRFDALAAGRYLLRTHPAGAGAGRRFVRIAPGAAVFEPFVLDETGASGRELRFAGGAFPLGGAPVTHVPAGDDALPSGEEAAGGAPAAEAADSGSRAAVADARRRGGRTWWLRRARRSVLKERTPGASLVQRGGGRAPGSGETAGFAERWAAAGHAPPGHPLAGLPGLPISGEVQLLTRATLAGPGFLWPSAAWPGQVAYVSVAPSGPGDWALRGTVDVTTGATSSWAIAGWYAAEPRGDHDLQVAISYSRQAHAAAADLRLDGGGPVDAGLPSREVGRLDVVDTWTVSPALEVGYGAELARYGYLEDGRLFSPRSSVTVAPAARTRVRAALSRNLTAPGGEQFLPPLDGVWLPPERTYTSLSGFQDLQAQEVRHAEVGLERDLGARAAVGVRRFSQTVDGQLLAMFAPGAHAPPGTLPASGGHYYLTAAGGVDAEGWGVTFSQELDERLRGAVDYRVVRAEWTPPGAAGAAQPAGLPRAGRQRFHDATATLEAEIPETSTRVVARCRVSTAFARPGRDGVTSGLDARFDVQVTQALPFAPFEGSDWELLVALRSLFHGPAEGASIHDELLVVDPPRQLVGGLVVHF